MIKIKSYGSAQTNINGKVVEKQKYALRSDGKKAHIIGEDNGQGYYIKIDNLEDLFNNSDNKGNVPLIKKLKKEFKKTKRRKKRKGRTRKKRKKKKKIFKFY